MRVDRLEPAGRDQPGARVRRHAVARPLLDAPRRTRRAAPPRPGRSRRAGGSGWRGRGATPSGRPRPRPQMGEREPRAAGARTKGARTPWTRKNVTTAGEHDEHRRTLLRAGLDDNPREEHEQRHGGNPTALEHAVAQTDHDHAAQHQVERGGEQSFEHDHMHLLPMATYQARWTCAGAVAPATGAVAVESSSTAPRFIGGVQTTAGSPRRHVVTTSPSRSFGGTSRPARSTAGRADLPGDEGLRRSQTRKQARCIGASAKRQRGSSRQR